MCIGGSVLETVTNEETVQALEESESIKETTAAGDGETKGTVEEILVVGKM